MDSRTRAREFLRNVSGDDLRFGRDEVEDRLTVLLDSVRREAMEEAARECVDESRMMAILHQDDASRSAAACYRRIRALATPTKPGDEP